MGFILSEDEKRLINLNEVLWFDIASDGDEQGKRWYWINAVIRQSPEAVGAYIAKMPVDYVIIQSGFVSEEEAITALKILAIKMKSVTLT